MLAVVLSSCANNASDSGAGRTQSNGTVAADSAALADAQAAVASYTNPAALNYPKPVDKFNPGRHRVAILAPGLTGAAGRQQAQFVADAAEAAGWQTSPILDGKFDPTLQANLVQQAATQGYEAIIFAAIDPKSIQSAIDFAQSKNVVVGCVMCDSPTDGVIQAGQSGYDAGMAMSAFIAQTAEGTGDVVSFEDKAYPIVINRIEGLTDGIQKYCPSCSYSVNQISATTLSQPGPPAWTSFLSANPSGSTRVAAIGYDDFAIPAAKSSVQAGRNDPLIVGFDGQQEFVQMIQKGDSPATSTVSAPIEYAAWAALDNVARKIAGAPTWDATRLPVAIVTKDNAGEFTQGYLKTPFSVSDLFKSMWTE
ncbi:sugar ABC transporter substrate-binding protein [Rhodococcus erythropolis]